MMKSHEILIFLCLLFACASLTQVGYCGVTLEPVYKKANLPTGGQFVLNPKVKSEIYYFTNRDRMWADKSNVQKLPGLYVSVDNGKAWLLLCDYFHFKNLFVNPVTGRLFAIIKYSFLAKDHGYLMPEFSDKAIASSDGKHWKDIMGKLKDSWLTSIFQDPDHPARVCLGGNGMSGFVLQSKDADYSDWELIPDIVWNPKHALTRIN